MPDDAPVKNSFSTWLRWGRTCDVLVRTALVLAVLVMLNHLGGRWYQRLSLHDQPRQPLSPRTVSLLQTITNPVKITLYFDRQEPVYHLVSALLEEYRDRNRHLQIATVDYLRDAGAAFKLKESYKDQGLGIIGTNRNLVIFDYEGRVKTINGGELAQYVTVKDPDADPKLGPLQFKKQVMFYGENLFTSALLVVLNPKPLKACFLTGHGEAGADDRGPEGYETFRAVLSQNFIASETCTLLGTSTVPADCHLLIVAGPTKPLTQSESDKLDDYLRQGGRLLALFNYQDLDAKRPSGLEKILAGWGVRSLPATLQDPKNAIPPGQAETAVLDFADHPAVNPLHGSALHVVLPRPVGRLDGGPPLADAPRVQALAYSSPVAVLDRGGIRGPARFPLAVAVEKGNVPGVITERGTTRIIAVGDSHLFGNHRIESVGNKDFAHAAVNWLLERAQLLQGLGPRPVSEYRIHLGAAQRHTLQWLLLGALPGAVLFLGGIVWLRRRK